MLGRRCSTACWNREASARGGATASCSALRLGTPTGSLGSSLGCGICSLATEFASLRTTSVPPPTREIHAPRIAAVPDSPPTCGVHRGVSPEIERSDSTPRVRSARSVGDESARFDACRDGGGRNRALLAAAANGHERSEISGARSPKADGRDGRDTRRLRNQRGPEETEPYSGDQEVGVAWSDMPPEERLAGLRLNVESVRCARNDDRSVVGALRLLQSRSNPLKTRLNRCIAIEFAVDEQYRHLDVLPESPPPLEIVGWGWPIHVAFKLRDQILVVIASSSS
jgi:hypothetical protein